MTPMDIDIESLTHPLVDAIRELTKVMRQILGVLREIQDEAKRSSSHDR